MNEKKQVTLEQYELTLEKFRLLPEDHQAVLAVLSYAVSEINALQRMFLAQELKMTDVEAVNSAIKIQYYVVLRSWSSKLFEALEFLNSEICGRKPQVKDERLLEFAENLEKRLGALRSGVGYETARVVRNEAANHYSFKAALRNLEHVRSQADCKLYTHVLGGNDFYPLGEEIMFQARLNRKWSSQKSEDAKREAFLSWLGWNLKATKQLSEICAFFFNKLVFEVLPDIEWSEQTHTIPAELVGHPSTRKTPVFSEILEQ
ncbi:MAG: hypothetical protein COB16_07505 [Rhodobacteraceae bacterium]|nr:MAG: hypothetical protein COB16_07505 [Paracoccaceae bacterium]